MESVISTLEYRIYLYRRIVRKYRALEDVIYSYMNLRQKIRGSPPLIDRNIDTIRKFENKIELQKQELTTLIAVARKVLDIHPLESALADLQKGLATIKGRLLL